MKLEEMAAFFEARLDGYDHQMLCNVEGCKEGYDKVVALLPADAEHILDLGCGTGLELDVIFAARPILQVTGVDLSQGMLDVLAKKHADKKLQLLCGDYFALPLGENKFDCAISVESLHHFSHEAKTALYSRIHAALKENGCYIECDYMVLTQQEEDALFAENERLRAQADIPQNVYCHFDTPCTVQNQIAMLRQAGFRRVTQHMRIGATTVLLAEK